MSHSSKPVVAYGYTGSPFAEKVDNLLIYKGIRHYKVDVPMTYPRPQLSELLGVAYRRVPVVAIGRDVFCDTSLITSVLERQYPKAKGYNTLFPPKKGGGSSDTGLIKAFIVNYADKPLFRLGADSLPYNKFSKDFIKDRSQFFGAEIDVEATMAKQPLRNSTVASHLALLEEQLQDGREWVFDTETPGLADFGLYMSIGWMHRMRNMREVMSETEFPKSISWIVRMKSFIKAQKDSKSDYAKPLTGEEAAKVIEASGSLGFAPVTFLEAEAKRLGIQKGEEVMVSPVDVGSAVPTKGILIGLDHEEVVVETGGTAVDRVHCHFPRLYFSITSATTPKAKL